MVFCIIENYLHSSARMTAHGPQVSDKKKETLGVELLGTVKHKLAVPQTYSSKVTDAFPGWVMIKDRLFHFTRNPHATP
jgi:hypothetical protein